ncbi:MAG: AAA family ATPase [Gemmatimonadota bacterium]|nr:AAA family ATPase [Gemmatimonadota bacterium]MDH3421660.1 AAA family ATPase [Gemmatimonadota bacterium]
MSSFGSAHTPTSSNGGRLEGPLPLVGRTRELASLEELMEGRGDRTSVVILAGEGGVGKSRLALELGERAGRRGWRVTFGRAFPVEAGVPYALFADAFMPILRSMDANALTVLSRGGEAELRYLFPALGHGEEPADVGADPDEFRTRLMWNFAEFLKSYATREPLLCVLEDLQWADESSLQLLHFLARQVTGHRILIVCTYNDTQRDQSLELVRTERSLVSLGVGEIRRLEPLTLEQVSELVHLTFGVDAEVVREFAALLFGWTRGNPFFLEEILKSLIASGRLSRHAGAWTGWDASDFGLPGSVRDAVITRVGATSENAQAVAELTAIVGARARYPLLASISGLPEDQLLGALEELCAARILDERTESGTVVYDFTHPLVRQTLYNEFGLQRARMLHGVVAEAMESFYADRALEHADELAFHFQRTDATQLRAKAAIYLAAAGRAALDRRADHEAVSYLRAALDRAEATDESGAGLKMDLVPRLARAYQHLGDFEQAASLWASALDQASDDGAEQASLRRALGMAHFWCGRHAEAQEHFDAGLVAAERAGDRTGEIRLRVAKAHVLEELGRGGVAMDTLAPALPLAEELADPGQLARVHRALALLHLWVGPPDRARTHAEHAIELARQIGDTSVEFWARWVLVVLESMRGDTAGMSDAVDQVNALADKARSPALRLWTADMSIELAYFRGEWDRAISIGSNAIALARNLNQRTLLPRLLVWTSHIYLGRGQVDAAKKLLDEAIQVSGINEPDASVDVHQVVPVYTGWAYYLVGLGDYDEAIEMAERGLEIAEGTGYTLWAMHRLLPILAEAYLWAGKIDEAAKVGERIRQHSNRLDHKLGHAWADSCEALVMWKRGDPAGAISLMRTAAEALEEIPMLWDSARIRRQMAGRMADVGATDEAALELKRVHEIFVTLGAELELEKARMQFREIGQRPPPKGSGEGVAGLTARELEVAHLVARRMSNKAIGKELGMAPRTASTHLSNIYQKLGIASRGELADLIRGID